MAAMKAPRGGKASSTSTVEAGDLEFGSQADSLFDFGSEVTRQSMDSTDGDRVAGEYGDTEAQWEVRARSVCECACSLLGFGLRFSRIGIPYLERGFSMQPESCLQGVHTLLFPTKNMLVLEP